jgi:hypothetical protein
MTKGRGDPAGPHRGSMVVVGWLISAGDEEEQIGCGEAWRQGNMKRGGGEMVQEMVAGRDGVL